MKPIQFILPLFFTVIFISCYPDDDFKMIPSVTTQSAGVLEFGVAVERDFIGEIVDQINRPLEGVEVRIGSKSTLTDANGVFIIRKATVSERFAYVKATHDGLIDASRSLVPSAGSNYIKIMMLPDNAAGLVESGEIATVEFHTGAKVTLQGEYIQNDGTAYDGSVLVVMAHLDPSNPDTQYQMPGMLLGQNTANQARVLKSFGMLGVELRGLNGEYLQVAPGSSAEISLPVDQSLITNAPATIPLWHFDEEAGYWIEEGEATLTDNEYVGRVSHFSFWNCDLPAQQVNICLNVTSENGNALGGLKLDIISENYGIGRGYTNELGTVCGIVPANESLVLEFYSPNCTNLIESTTIGPFNSDVNLSFSIDETTESIFEHISGTLVDCNQVAIENGYAYFEVDQQRTLQMVTDGQMQFNTLRCDNSPSFRIWGIDINNNMSTGKQTFDFNTPNTDIGPLATCIEINEYLTYQVANHPVITYRDRLWASPAWIHLDRTVHDPYRFMNRIGLLPEGEPYSSGRLFFVDANGNRGRASEPDYIISVVDERNYIEGYVKFHFYGTVLIQTGEVLPISGSGQVYYD